MGEGFLEGGCPHMLVKRLTFAAQQELSEQWGRILRGQILRIISQTVDTLLVPLFCWGTGVKGGIEAEEGEKEREDNGGTLFLFRDCCQLWSGWSGRCGEGEGLLHLDLTNDQGQQTL